jgi:HSP20 family protein
MLADLAFGARWPDMAREMRRLQEEVNRLFGGIRPAAAGEYPPVNVWVGANGAIVTAEIPGLASDQIDITVHQDTVTLRGKREPAVPDKEATVLREERESGAFARTLVLPFRVDAEKAAARFERGILVLELPRPAADKPRQIKITAA